jgi:hypothetical protein
MSGYRLFQRTLPYTVMLLATTAGCGLLKPASEPVLKLDCSPAPPRGTTGLEGQTGQSLRKDALGIASTLEFLPLWDRVNEAQQALTKENSGLFNLIHSQQQVLARMMLVSLEIQGVTAEVDCDRTKVEELLDSLEKRQSTRSNTETAASVILSGITNVLTGGLTIAMNTVADGVAAIVGGTLSGSLGALAMAGQVSHQLNHERNLLAEVWEERSEPRFFPKHVWRLLTAERADGTTVRDKLRENWRDKLNELQEKQHEDRSQLIFSQGGIYRIEDLRTLLTMLDGLSATLELMQQDVQIMVQYWAEPSEASMP